MPTITEIRIRNAAFPLPPGVGSDAVHRNPTYSYAVTELLTDAPVSGIGLAFTLGPGTDLVCQACEFLSSPLVGREIEELMAEWGDVSRDIADQEQYRWLGPHKGVVHLALASITNACFDLWAKSHGVPLWKRLLDLDTDALVRTLDLSYLEDVLPASRAHALLEKERPSRDQRSGVLDAGYPGYDTSIGWFDYDDQRISDNAQKAIDEGFSAVKLKVGSDDIARDVRRVGLVREAIGDGPRLMVDANQQWTPLQARSACRQLIEATPLHWIEEPTHPDDIHVHAELARDVAPTAIAAGEHIPNRVLFKGFMLAEAAKIIQVDAVRVGGISEFIAVSLMARHFGLSVIPHVGDMGQIHQHLVLFNHIALGLPLEFLEHIPHLSHAFVNPAVVTGGVYKTPQSPGASSDLTA